MFNFMRNKPLPLYFNKNLSNYCTKKTIDSITNLTEKYKLERTKPKYEILLGNSAITETPEINSYALLIFLSISSFGFFYYKSLN